MSRQSRFDARYWMLGAGALGRPRGMVWGGRREEGSGWGTHVYLWQIHFDIWQNQKKKIFLGTLPSMQDLSSLARDQTHAPCGGSLESTTGPPGKSLPCF